MSHNPANLLVALAASRPATVERAQISSRRLKPFDNSQQSTRPAALPAAVSPSAGLPERLDSIHTPHPRNSNPHNPHRAIHVPHPAVSSLGGLRTPAPVCAAPPSWGRHPKTFTEAVIKSRHALRARRRGRFEIFEKQSIIRRRAPIACRPPLSPRAASETWHALSRDPASKCGLVDAGYSRRLLVAMLVSQPGLIQKHKQD